MKPTTITQYGVYYSYNNVPFDNCDADWIFYQAYPGLKEAEDFIADDKALNGGDCFYIILEEVTERTFVYSEVGNE